jgi:capsular exopolysaccharide synthesis family protein
VLGLPSLGVVPHLELGEPAKLWRWRPGRHVPDRRPIVAFEDRPHQEHTRALEAYRSLRTALLLSHAGAPPRVVLVTSAMPGEGKTTTAINLAIALSQTGARTILVDMDMRKPSLTAAFEIPPGLGMSTYLSGNSELPAQVLPASFENLYLLAAGPVAPNPAELAGSTRMAAAVQLLAEYFNHVVIDSPPALELADALVLSPMVDGVILVSRAGRTPRKALAAVAGRIANVGGTLLGVVVNDVDLSAGGYGYYGYYGHYGSGTARGYLGDDLKNRTGGSE